MKTQSTAKTKSTVKPSVLSGIFAQARLAPQAPSHPDQLAAEPPRRLFTAEPELSAVEIGDLKRKGEILAIKLPLITPDPQQPRRSFDANELAKLQTTIASQGLIQPINVVERSDKPGHYRIVTGERRFRACQGLGLETIDARVMPALSPIESLTAQLVENADCARSSVPPWEEAKGLAVVLAHFNNNQHLTANNTGLPVYWINKRVKLLDLPACIQELFDKFILSDLETANALRRLHEVSAERAEALCAEAVQRNQIGRGEVHKALRDEKRKRSSGYLGTLPPAMLATELGQLRPRFAQSLAAACGGGGVASHLELTTVAEAEGQIAVSFRVENLLVLKSLLDSLKAR